MGADRSPPSPNIEEDGGSEDVQARRTGVKRTGPGPLLG